MGACLVKEGSTEMDQSLVKEGVRSPSTCSRMEETLVLCHLCPLRSITFVRGAAVEPLSALGSGGCLLEDESSQASDVEEFL